VARGKLQQQHGVVDMLDHVADEDHVETFAHVGLRGGIHAAHVEAAPLSSATSGSRMSMPTQYEAALVDAAVAPVAAGRSSACAVRNHADVEHALARAPGPR
jgi:hypothetical protein